MPTGRELSNFYQDYSDGLPDKKEINCYQREEEVLEGLIISAIVLVLIPPVK